MTRVNHPWLFNRDALERMQRDMWRLVGIWISYGVPDDHV